jgi:hypothetical protein
MASERTIRPYAWLSVSASLLLIVAASTHARAQTDQLGEEERLEREFTNPLTTLPQLLVRDSYSPATYGRCNLLACPRNAETNQIIIRPLFPRIPSNTLLPFIQLVRPTFSVLTVPSSRGGVRTEFGDLPLFDIAVLPWPDRQKTLVSRSRRRIRSGVNPPHPCHGDPRSLYRTIVFGEAHCAVP